MIQRGRETMDRHFQERISRRTGIASQAFIPRETPMCALCAGLSLRRFAVLFLLPLKHLRRKNDGLRTKQLEPATPDGTAWPITPQDWERSGFGGKLRWKRLKHRRRSLNGGRWRRCRKRCVGRDRPNHRTDADAGLLVVADSWHCAEPRTRTAMARASTVDHAHRAIALRSALLHR